MRCFKRPALLHAGDTTQYFFLQAANYQRLHRQEKRYKQIKLPDSLSMRESLHHEESPWFKLLALQNEKIDVSGGFQKHNSDDEGYEQPALHRWS